MTDQQQTEKPSEVIEVREGFKAYRTKHDHIRVDFPDGETFLLYPKDFPPHQVEWSLTLYLKGHSAGFSEGERAAQLRMRSALGL